MSTPFEWSNWTARHGERRWSYYKGLLNLPVFIESCWWPCCMFVCFLWDNKWALTRGAGCLTMWLLVVFFTCPAPPFAFCQRSTLPLITGMWMILGVLQQPFPSHAIKVLYGGFCRPAVKWLLSLLLLCSSLAPPTHRPTGWKAVLPVIGCCVAIHHLLFLTATPVARPPPVPLFTSLF